MARSSSFAMLAGPALLLALSACALPQTAEQARAEQQRAKSLERAADYCRKKGMAMRPGGVYTPIGVAPPPAEEVPFRCVKSG